MKIILAVIVAAVALVLVTPDIRRKINNRNLRTIEVNGVKYRQKPDVKSYVLMGVDRFDKEGKTTGTPNGNPMGDNDLNLIMVIDHKNKTWQLLQINRDSMMDVSILDMLGHNNGTMYEQLALAHSYGMVARKAVRMSVMKRILPVRYASSSS